jgi:BirA family biotin operon repressor/biotin-[acetyl-CoA-carboxylase] ligase
MNFSENQKKILEILADGNFHSGSEIAQLVSISRSAICKHLHYFTALGIANTAISGKGYRLHYPLELLDPNEMQHWFSKQTRRLIANLEIHDFIDSTNTQMNVLERQDQPSGTICFAECQTAGKGRRGRQWVSSFGSNIALSVLWRFQQGPAAISGLSLVIGVAVVRALKSLNFLDIGVKWPNDIFWQYKKLGGILVEVSGETEGPCSAIIGIGLNGFIPDPQAEEITQDWTDLTKISGHFFIHRNQLAAALLNELLPIIASFETQTIQQYLEEWRDYDCMLGQAVTLFIGKQQIAGIVRGIDDKGLLQLERPDGDLQVFASGEVSFSCPV